MGFFDRLREGLTRTKEQIVSRFEEIVQKADTEEQRTRPVDVDTIEALEELLISADVGIPATERIVNAVRGRARRGESLRDLVKDEIRKVFDTVERPDVARTVHQPARHAHRRRQRHREDDDHRQAGQSAQGVGQAAAGVRGRHVQGRGGRAARDLGEAGRRRYRAREGRVGSGRGGLRRDPVGKGATDAIRFWWTRPAACTRA